MQPVLVGEEILWENGPVARVRRYYAGVHPELGLITRGWSGLETVFEGVVLRPTAVFAVEAVQVAAPADVYLAVPEPLAVAV